MTAGVVAFWMVVLGLAGFFVWRRKEGKSPRVFPPVSAPLEVATWNRQSTQFTFGMPSGWRDARKDEIEVLSNVEIELVALVKTDQPDARWAEMIAWRVGTQREMGEVLKHPNQIVVARTQLGRLVGGPTKMMVARGRAVQLQFSEVMSGAPYGSSTDVEQARVETFFEGAGGTWMFQLVGPADTLAAQLLAYQTALGTWRWN